MNKLILILSLIMLGCINNDKPTIESQSVNETIKMNKDLPTQDIKIIVFQGCQYMYVKAGNQTWGSHMGNCNNPIHK